MGLLVSAAWLAGELGRPDLVTRFACDNLAHEQSPRSLAIFVSEVMSHSN
jgi:hypothetical protein